MWAAALAAGLAAALSTLAPAAGQVTPPQWNYTGTLNAIIYKGIPRSYHLFEPRKRHDADANRGGLRKPKHPLIIALHGNGADASAFALQTPDLAREAPARGYFLVYPEGVQTPTSKARCRERSWNSGTCCDEAYLNDVDDVGFLRDTLEDIFRVYPSVDRQRVFAIGTSNGGSMVVRLACSLPSYLAGVAPEIASFEGRDGRTCGANCEAEDGEYESCEWDRHKKGCGHGQFAKALPMIYSCDALRDHPTPMLFFNGDLDPLSNISGLVERPLKFNASEYTTSFPPMQFGIDHILQATGCTHPKKHVTFRNGTKHNQSHCTTYTSATCATNVTACVSNAGHRWCVDAAAAGLADTRPIRAALAHGARDDCATPARPPTPPGRARARTPPTLGKPPPPPPPPPPNNCRPPAMIVTPTPAAVFCVVAVPATCRVHLVPAGTAARTTSMPYAGTRDTTTRPATRPRTSSSTGPTPSASLSHTSRSISSTELAPASWTSSSSSTSSSSTTTSSYRSWSPAESTARQR